MGFSFSKILYFVTEVHFMKLVVTNGFDKIHRGFGYGPKVYNDFSRVQ
jgi:hypothetical protein